VDAENCIRGFYLAGYEAKFARVSRIEPGSTAHLLTSLQLSHNARLKALHEPSNTNLYVSNLPKHINEDVGFALACIAFGSF